MRSRRETNPGACATALKKQCRPPDRHGFCEAGARDVRRSGLAQVRLAVLTCLGAITIAGCAGKPPLAQVEGTVRLDGRPLSDVLVCFLPDPDKQTSGPRSVAVTDENGQYRLRCDDQREGAVLGWHRVLLEDMTLYSVSRQDRAGGSRPALVSRLSPRYTTATQTPLYFEVKPGTQTIDLDLKSRP
jgi:hypothetical protein